MKNTLLLFSNRTFIILPFLEKRQISTLREMQMVKDYRTMRVAIGLPLVLYMIIPLLCYTYSFVCQHIQSYLIPGRYAFYAMISEYFDQLKYSLKSC